MDIFIGIDLLKHLSRITNLQMFILHAMYLIKTVFF